MAHPRKNTIVHKGKTIVVHDYVGVPEDQFVDTIRQLTETVVQGADPSLLLLLDISGCTISKDVLLAFKRAAAAVKPHVSKVAVVGVQGLQMFFLNVVNLYATMAVQPFPTREAAFDYLVD